MIGFKGTLESYKTAKKRAELAADELIQLANEYSSVVLFGHGYMNLHIRRELASNGWTVSCKDNDYWGLSRLEIK